MTAPRVHVPWRLMLRMTQRGSGSTVKAQSYVHRCRKRRIGCAHPGTWQSERRAQAICKVSCGIDHGGLAGSLGSPRNPGRSEACFDQVATQQGVADGLDVGGQGQGGQGIVVEGVIHRPSLDERSRRRGIPLGEHLIGVTL